MNTNRSKCFWAPFFLAVLLSGCSSLNNTPLPVQPRIWMTYARNIPHAPDQRVNMFLSSEAPAVVVAGFPDQFVILSVHEVPSDRVIFQTTQFVTARKGRGVTLDPLRPGHYIARVSQEGVRKAETMFMVR